MATARTFFRWRYIPRILHRDWVASGRCRIFACLRPFLRPAMRGFGESEVRLGGRWLAAVLATLALSHPASAASARCFSPPGASVEAEGARDGTTLLLKDGREARLADIHVPTGFDSSGEAARRATAALDALVARHRLTLYAAGSAPDRYGRIQVQAVADGGRWIQAALVAAGFARVMPGSQGTACIAELLAFERTARASKSGLWDGAFSVFDAAGLKAAAVSDGGFVLVEGTVRHVGEAGGWIFLDFGPRDRRHFTIVIPRDAHASFAAAGIDLRGLSGRRVRGRGMLFDRSGPAMELRIPAALEVLGTDRG